MISIQPDDQIVSAWGECAAGPGWANQPLWVIVRSREGKLRMACIQPEDQTMEIHTLFKVSAVVSAQMCKAVEECMKSRSKRKAKVAFPSEKEILASEPSGYELVRIPGGSFTMGSPESEEDSENERPLHEVQVSDFYLGRYPVTNEEYGRFLQKNPEVKEPRHWSDLNYWADRRFNLLRQPVVGVSWGDAQAYCQWAGLRLPTEMEWEYATRAGSVTRWSFGDDEKLLGDYVWFYGNSEHLTHPVGEKEPNPFGLYDMHGNVLEWVEDDWHENYQGAPSDGRAWIDIPRGFARVLRGGSWNYANTDLFRCAFRNLSAPTYWCNYIGFRCARGISP